ncbi:iron dicitrate transport regulator FecR [Pseudoduganella sp. FT25W]|uniref:Iron dicitrate transport regulator FecR n=1 Tax=Duganella alba TaxID=2666081 RepID=A0A6L5QCA5_9BURK|nr:FecR family protein [Duganella alba]MRX07386.1 iron dicitrate transport regulator FecR [Duganella alba]MRX20266.1 iron dicitrate transport regulator FecR [Duganella alba]
MKQLKNSTAIKAWLALLLFWVAGASWAAQVAGTIVQLSGPLMAKRSDGAVRILSMKSEVESGDTLVTEKNTYAMVKFIDNSEITLKPSTTFKVENFSYDADKPDGDAASFNLVKGGLRSVTGLLGKRNKEKFSMKTPSATIGIRGTTFIAEWVEPSEQAVAQAAAARQAWLMASTAGLGDSYPVQPLMLAQANIPPLPGNSGRLAPGLYVQVIDGLINLTNKGGSLNFAAGQFGFTPTIAQPPVIVPQNPGMQFTPPPVFNAPTGQTTPGNTATKSNTVDCEVR